MFIFSSANSVYSVLNRQPELVYCSTKTPPFLCTHHVITILLLLIRGLVQFSCWSKRPAISLTEGMPPPPHKHNVLAKKPLGKGAECSPEPRHWYSLPLGPAPSDCKSRSWLDHQAGHCVITMGYAFIYAIRASTACRSSVSSNKSKDMGFMWAQDMQRNRYKEMELQQKQISPTCLNGECFLWNINQSLMSLQNGWTLLCYSIQYSFEKGSKKVNNRSV